MVAVVLTRSNRAKFFVSSDFAVCIGITPEDKACEISVDKAWPVLYFTLMKMEALISIVQQTRPE